MVKKFVVLVMLLCGAAVVVRAQIPRNRRAPRTFENPHPELELKQLFPAATIFPPTGGSLPHVTAYRTDPRTDPAAKPLGFAFWTTDLVPNEHGYHGPIRILVGLDMTGVLAGVVVDADTEPYGYFSVEVPQFAAQFRGKSIRDGFRVGVDVDRVSRASLSVGSAARAIRDSSRMAAKALVPQDSAK
jgi:transcriptional regulator of nitric oxide reductase